MLMTSVWQRLPCLLHASCNASFVPTLVTEAVRYEVVSTHTYKLAQTAASTLSLKMKHNHCLFCSSAAVTEYRHWCWFLQSTTEQFACLALSDDFAKHCYLTAGHTELHLGDGRPPLGYLRGEGGSVFTQRRPAGLLSLRKVRSWIWTTCKILPVGGLQKMQDLFAFLILGVGGLKEDQFIYVETRENVFFTIWDL